MTPISNTPKDNKLDTKEQGKTSLVIPCSAKHAPLVQYVLETANYQTQVPLEVIVVLSGMTTNKALEFQDQWCRQLNPRISFNVITNPAKQPAGINRQLGAMASQGEIISWFDADDLQSPTRIERIENAFLDSDIQVVYHRFERSGDPEPPATDRDAFLFRDASQMYHRGWVSVRRTVISQLSWSAEPRAQDFSYMKQLIGHLGAGSIALLPDFLGCYFQYPLDDSAVSLDDKRIKLISRLRSYSQLA